MLNSIAAKKIMISMLIYLSLFLSTILADYCLHLLGFAWIGRYLGIIGTIIIVTSFLYSLRKRKIIKSGSPKMLLQSHETLGWIGALFICIHSGIHFNAIIPWIALASMLIVVASGLLGKNLLNASKEELLRAKEDLRISELNKMEIEKRLFLDSLLVDKMQKWRKIHMPLTAIFVVFALLHIVSILLLW